MDETLPAPDAESLAAPAAEAVPEPGAEAPEERDPTLFQRLKTMSMGEKTKLALTGGKEARVLLLRENNKMLTQMVLKNPRITLEEVVELAKSRSAAGETLSMISQSREWMKSYPLRLAMTTNPKTPLPIALRLVRGLLDPDVRRLAKSRDVPQIVSTEAKKLVARRGQG